MNRPQRHYRPPASLEPLEPRRLLSVPKLLHLTDKLRSGGAPAATSVGDLALFGGYVPAPEGMGLPVPPWDSVDVYNAASSTWSSARLSVARNELAATSAGNKALFGGGFISGLTEFDPGT